MRRIGKELADIQNDKQSNIQAKAAHGDDLTNLKASFPGPPDTPYEGGTFIVDIKIPQEYPFKPPIMKFETKLWHPNVSSVTVSDCQGFNVLWLANILYQGAICLDTLGTAWSPVLTIKSALLSLQSLLSTPEPNDPQDAEVAMMLKRRPQEFAKVAHDWAVKYAGAPRKNADGSNMDAGPAAPQAQKSKEQLAREEAARYQGYSKALVDRFVDMGFDVEKVVEAFQYVGIDPNDGHDYELEEAYMGDITARLLHEP